LSRGLGPPGRASTSTGEVAGVRLEKDRDAVGGLRDSDWLHGRSSVDYDQPNGATISLAVVRLPASDPAHRIGSLFLNPGGPGGSGVDFAVFAGPFLYNDSVRAHFDLVGFDPRGIGRSTALRCFGTPKQWGPYFTPFAFPSTPAEEVQSMNADLYLDSNCAQRGGKIADHMSTANVARDLDQLRQAVGDMELTYAGVSYGTMIGQTYANMFPSKVRALIIDGVLDPIAWTTGSGDASTVRSRRGCTATSARRRRWRSFSASATPARVRSARTRRRASKRSPTA
jgi:pimeloyl-ACP methyl ester carboxylesterase